MSEPQFPYTFPKHFWWGNATAGHQVEGNNLHSDWWEWEKKGLVHDGTVSGRACDYWNRYAEDHALMKELGFGCFRMGVEWARIEPEEGRFDEAALDHYRAMVDDLQERGIKVCLTLNHWVIPQWFSRMERWEASDALHHWERFLDLVIPRLGSAVDLWVTLNEPMVPILAGHILGHFPPEKKNPLAAAKVFKVLLQAHAMAYHKIHGAFSKAPGGGPVMAGYAGAYQWVAPWDDEFTPKGLLQRLMADFVAQGSYRAWDDSLLSGRVALPFGVGQEVDGLKDSTDFNGVNYYMRMSVHHNLRQYSNVMADGYPPPEGIEQTEMGWEVYPPGFYNVLRDVYTRFGKPIYITENGCCDSGDEMRRRYLLQHLVQVQKAIADGTDVRGYFHWTFCDNFEWREGFAKKFGIIELDHDDPDLTRKPRQSAHLFKDVIEANAVTKEIVQAHSPGALDRWH